MLREQGAGKAWEAGVQQLPYQVCAEVALAAREVQVLVQDGDVPTACDLVHKDLEGVEVKARVRVGEEGSGFQRWALKGR